MSERVKLRDAEINKAHSDIVFRCPKCRGSGINTKESVKIDMIASEETGLLESDDSIMELKRLRKKKHIKRHNENPNNSSYGLCSCYVQFEFVKGLIVGDLPLKFKNFDLDGILPRDVIIEGGHEKKSLIDFLKTYIDKFPELKNNSVGVNFIGKIGTGRSFISQFLGSEILKKRYSVHYIPYFSLAKIVPSYDSIELLREIFDVDLLIIDEIGNEHPNRRGYSGEIAYAIQKRIQSNKVTFFGFNGTPTEGEIIELYGGSFFSVMHERNINVKFTKKAIPKSSRTKYINKVLDEI